MKVDIYSFIIVSHTHLFIFRYICILIINVSTSDCFPSSAQTSKCLLNKSIFLVFLRAMCFCSGLNSLHHCLAPLLDIISVIDPILPTIYTLLKDSYCQTDAISIHLSFFIFTSVQLIPSKALISYFLQIASFLLSSDLAFPPFCISQVFWLLSELCFLFFSPLLLYRMSTFSFNGILSAINASKRHSSWR